jgi:hypothetical protein
MGSCGECAFKNAFNNLCHNSPHIITSNKMWFVTSLQLWSQHWWSENIVYSCGKEV